MTLKLLDVRIGQIWLESSPSAIDGKAPGPFGGAGHQLGYEKLFAGARDGAGGAALPWPAKSPRSTKFWKKYVTGRLRPDNMANWPGIGWNTLVPLKVPAALPSIRLHAGQSRGHSEAYVWPTGFGFTWNNWIAAELDVADLAGILARIRNGQVDYAAPDGTVASERLAKLAHAALDSLRGSLWGNSVEGTRSDPVTIVSVVRAVDDPAGSVPDALKTLLDQLAQAWSERPQILPDDRYLTSGESVYVAKGLRLVWRPDNFLGGSWLHRGGCFHRNLLLASLQAESLAAAATMLAGVLEENGSLPESYMPLVQRVLDRIDFFVSGGGYSAPFLSAQLERGPVLKARRAIEKI